MAPKLRKRPIVMTEQGGTAEAAFDAVDGTIDSITTAAVFSHYKPNPYKETAVEQSHIDNIFMELRVRDFRGLNHKFVLLRRASLNVGTNII